ncbi:MAG: sialate O-acetylesterase, partial [Bacteroidota bacterium]|nr:sialate O-acetylesterase [Bacteroidota bacterium]
MKSIHSNLARHFIVSCILFFLIIEPAFSFGKKIKVACLGNSVTYGYHLPHREIQSYPAQLQNLLGDNYLVKNFGHNGATLLKNGHNPYYKTPEFVEALEWRPDITIIHLGLNDTDPRDWPDYRGEFMADYSWLIDTLRKVNTAMKIYICMLTPIFSDHPRFKSGTRNWFWQIQKEIPQIAKANHITCIDLHKPLFDRPDLFPDNLHPTTEGATIIAKTVFQIITGDFGGFRLASIFEDHMVLQRDRVIPIYGVANVGEKVTLTFSKSRYTAKTGINGKWIIKLPPMHYGGPYSMVIQSNDNKIIIRDILIGDVWICSGQSNMDFPLKRAASGNSELSHMKNMKLLRLFHDKEIQETNDVAWDSLTLLKTNELKYFSGNWRTCIPGSVKDF